LKLKICSFKIGAYLCSIKRRKQVSPPKTFKTMITAKFTDETKTTVTVETTAWFLNIDAAHDEAEFLIRTELGPSFCRGKWTVVEENVYHYEVEKKY